MSHPITLTESKRLFIQTSNANLVALATFTSQTIDMINARILQVFSVMSTAAFDVEIDESNDGVTWFKTSDTTTAAGVVFTRQHTMTLRYARVRVVNNDAVLAGTATTISIYVAVQ